MEKFYTIKIMKICSKMLITTSLFFMYILNSINAEQCSPKYCPRGINASVYSTDVSVKYPFRLNDQHSTSCGGVPGFDLYCNETFGTLIRLPHNVSLRVDSIDYYNQKFTLSDPFNCLPQKCMSLDLTSTPFIARYTMNFWLYTCYADTDYSLLYDQIDCMSGPGYTTVSFPYNMGNFISSECSFSRILSIPCSYYYSSSSYLSYVSTIDLYWTGFPTPPTPPPPRNAIRIGIPIGLGGAAFAVLILLCYCRQCKRRNAQATLTTTTTNTTIDMTTRSQSTQPSTTSVIATTVVVEGLDQATIVSYPLVVLSESSGLLKSDDNTCSICLSEYQPLETLKFLPQCLHRFHEECIDPWLRCNAVCPICRTSLTSSN